MAYRHTQVGWAMILILGGIITLFAVLAPSSGGAASIALVLVIVLLVVCLALFFSLTVVVDERGIELRMGAGVIRRHVKIGEIESVTQHHLPWWAVAYGDPHVPGREAHALARVGIRNGGPSAHG